LLYLVMALAWLSLALVAFVIPRLNPDGQPWTIMDIPVSWIAVVLCVYNLIHWWARRHRHPDRRLLRPTPPRPVHPEQPPDPNFNFTDNPPPPRSDPS
jgi:hypothetical protein